MFSSDQFGFAGEGCVANWVQIVQDGLHFLLLFTGDCTIVAVVELLAEVGPPMAEGIAIVTFLTGTFSHFGGAWQFSWVGGIGHCLVTNKFTEAGTMEAHGVKALVGFVVMGMVVDVLVGIGTADIAGSMWGFSTIQTLFCFLPCLDLALFFVSSLSFCSFCYEGVLGLSG